MESGFVLLCGSCAPEMSSSVFSVSPFFLSSPDGSLDCGTTQRHWFMPLRASFDDSPYLWLERRVKEKDALRALQLLVPLFNPAYLSIPPWS